MTTCRVHPEQPLRYSPLGVPYCKACRDQAALKIRAKVQQKTASVEFDAPTPR